MACECLIGQMGRLLMFLLLTGGMVCGFLAASSCEFFSYSDAADAESLPGPYMNVTSASVGLFASFDKNAKCQFYDETLMNADGIFNVYWITAQFSAIIGPGTCYICKQPVDNSPPTSPHHTLTSFH